MSALLITGPAAEPLTLAEAKGFLRVEHGDDDGLIAALIAGARAHVEALTRRALITQTWRIVLDAWPARRRLEVPLAPLRSIVAARVYDAGGAAQALDPEIFVTDLAAAPPMIAWGPGGVPAPGRVIAGIEIDVELGYGATAAHVPEPLRQAVRLLAAHWYENRQIVAAPGAVLPAGVAVLIAPYRVVSL